MNNFKRIAETLEKYGLDAVMLTGEANRFYAAGFNTTGEDGIAVVTKDKNYFMTDSRYIEAVQNNVNDAVIGLVDGNKDYLKWLQDIIAEHKIQRLGFEEESMTVVSYQKYCNHFDCELVPASAMMTKLRSQKSDDELKIMRQAQKIAEKALNQMISEIKIGMTEKEIAARLQYLMITYGAEKTSFDTIVASGPNSSMPHAVPTDRAVQNGDFITIDMGCVYKGYCSDMTRTFALGSATDEMREVYDIVLKAQLAGITKARAGVSGYEVDKAARDVITEAGYGEYFGHGFGHSLGIEIHEDPNANTRNKEALPVNAVISAEPGIYIPGKFGVRIEDTLILREDGNENLMSIGKELTII